MSSVEFYLNIDLNHPGFQQDGCPAYLKQASAYLNQVYTKGVLENTTPSNGQPGYPI